MKTIKAGDYVYKIFRSLTDAEQFSQTTSFLRQQTMSNRPMLDACLAHARAS